MLLKWPITWNNETIQFKMLRIELRVLKLNVDKHFPDCSSKSNLLSIRNCVRPIYILHLRRGKRLNVMPSGIYE